MNESRATRHQRLKRRVRAAAVVSGGAMMGLVALTPLGEWWARWSQDATAGLPLGLNVIAAFVIFVAGLVLAWEAAMLPAVYATRVSGTGRQESGAVDGAWSLSALAPLLLMLPAAAGAAGVVQLAVLVAGSYWWLLTGVLLGAALVGLLHAAPGWMARYSGARPVERPALVERLGELARRVSVPIYSIDEVPAGAGVTSTALVTGAGDARRVFISSELIRDWSDDHIAVVVAHELAHHAHHDLWQTLALDVAVLCAGFWTAGVVMGATGLGTPGSLAALPMIALVAGAVWLLATPLRHAVSRHQERRADVFALALTGAPDAFRAALRRLAERHLVEERPSRLTQWLYHRHPSVAERLEAANQSINRSIG